MILCNSWKYSMRKFVNMYLSVCLSVLCTNKLTLTGWFPNNDTGHLSKQVSLSQWSDHLVLEKSHINPVVDRSNGMSISADSPSDETLNRGPLALLLRRLYGFPFENYILQFSFSFFFSWEQLWLTLFYKSLTHLLPRKVGEHGRTVTSIMRMSPRVVSETTENKRDITLRRGDKCRVQRTRQSELLRKVPRTKGCAETNVESFSNFLAALFSRNGTFTIWTVSLKGTYAV